MVSFKKHPLSKMEIDNIPSVDAARDVLCAWGRNDLADRIGYFASDEDLEDGDVPVTLESVLGFLAFFAEVESTGKLDLACSPEGWICAVWRFSDPRRATLWFLDRDNVMYAACKSDGAFADLDEGQETGSRSHITSRLVEFGEWFQRIKED